MVVVVGCLLCSRAYAILSLKVMICTPYLVVGGYRLCFAKSRLSRPRITWPVEVQNSDPVG